MKRRKSKIIIYELNEVPKRLINTYIKDYPNSAIAEIIEKGVFLNTFTNDDGELHPWSTWPTVHRGVNNNTHNIRYLNQDLSPSIKYKPIWEILTENGIDAAVFGSLQSYPPPKNKNYRFYLPDTFSPNSEAFPKELSLFQELNLNLTTENKAKSSSISQRNIRDFLYLCFKGVISKRSASKAIIHVLKERINPKYKSLRSTVQNILSFKIYLKYLYKYQPSFSTYFTNHVAGMMHRYWKNLYPNDFGLSKNQIDKFHSNTIIKAMHLADKNLRDLITFSKKKDYELLVISSMGQGPIERGEYVPELVLRDFEKLLKLLEFNPNDYKLLPAMQPDYCIEAKNAKAMEILRNNINLLTDNEGKKLLIERYPPVGLKLNLSLQNYKSISKSRFCEYNKERHNIEDIGFELITRDIGTGYHVPEGIFLWFGKESKRLHHYSDKKIDTCSICPTILDLYGINIPRYMQKPL